MELLRIKELLKEKNIAGKELAERVGVSANSISQISTGQKFPRPELLLKISEELNVDIRELFKPTIEDPTEPIYVNKDGHYIPIGFINEKKI